VVWFVCKVWLFSWSDWFCRLNPSAVWLGCCGWFSRLAGLICEILWLAYLAGLDGLAVWLFGWLIAFVATSSKSFGWLSWLF
jgi:hypothetical protein